MELIENLKLKIKNSSGGITLIEIVVVIFITILFAMMVISDFPKIQKQHALSAATYKLAQDLRRAEDLGLSGVSMNDKNNNPIKAKGYGIYFTINSAQYVIYADVDGTKTYNKGQPCDLSTRDLNLDCAIETVYVNKQSSSVFIPKILQPNLSSIYIGVPVHINFNPPGPTINIKVTNIFAYTSVGVVLSNGLTNRTVWVNTSGLINVQ